jgi:hypothetical protein
MDLSTIFQSVTTQLSEKKETLNNADDYNHDHGDHMVQIFSLIQDAVSKRADKPVADQLKYASKVVEKEADSGSGKLYAQGLANAAKNFSGNDLNPSTIGVLVKSLLNVEEPQQTQSNDNVLGSLLSGLMGNSDSDEDGPKLGVDELLRAGMAFYQSKQDGDSNSEAIMGALLAASPLGQSPHRSQSGSLVASTIMDIAQSMKN